MNVWSYSGSVLTFSACSLENPKDTLIMKTNIFQQFDSQELLQSTDLKKEVDKSKEDEEYYTLEVTFLCLCFIHNLIITGGEDGFVTSFWE